MIVTIVSVFLMTTAFTMPAAGQLAAPNVAGVSLGHIHLYVSDVAAHQKFWATMGGVPGKCSREGRPMETIALIADPWGTKLEITEGIAP